jgi:hypothetical protein
MGERVDYKEPAQGIWRVMENVFSVVVVTMLHVFIKTC